MNDQLERDIRNLFCNTGELSRDEVTSILLGLLERIQHLEQLRPAQEPVAWMLEWAFNGEERGYRLYDDERHCVFDAESDGGVCRPLYTSPPAQRKPLTDEEIESINVRLAGKRDLARLFARGIEAAHGIKENT
jgi:hypothetical protein